MVAKGARGDESPSKREPKRTYRKSPARTEKPKSPSKVPEKTPPGLLQPRRSIGRSPARSTAKSPSRKSPSRKSPGRKSPSRLKKDTETIVPDRPKRTSRSRNIIVVDSESDEDTDSYLRRNTEKLKGTPRKEKMTITSPKVVLQNIMIPSVKEATPVDNYISLVRRSVTKSRTREIDHIDHLKHESSPALSVRKLTELSDEDDVAQKASREQSECRSKSQARITPSKVGGLFRALFIVLLPSIPIIFSVYCNETQCNFNAKPPSLAKYKLLSTYFDVNSLAISFGFALFVGVLSALPFGGSKICGLPNKQGRLNYVMNGFFSLLVIGTVLIALEIYRVPVIESILKKYFQLLMSLIILGVFLSFALYVRSFYVPLCALKTDALINSALTNFINGREVNPRIFGVIDVKVCLFRMFCIGTILIDAILIYKHLEFNSTNGVVDFKSVKYNSTLLVVAIMQIIYFMDSMIYETAFVTTYTAQYQGVGYEIAMYMTFGPTMAVAVTKYVYDFGVVLPQWHLITASVLFFIGFVLYRASNLQKHAFRLNPYNPTISHLESLPTRQGKKLLVSGYWGFVRHPNYLGDILMKIALAMFTLKAIPVLIYIMDACMLLERAHQDGLQCKQKYGSAWDRYCQRVKYSVIPKIY